MEKPRRMSPGAEEIYEVSDSSDELDLVYHSKGLNPVRCRRRGNGRCGTAPHCDEDELSQLIEMLDRESSRIRDSQQKGKNSFSWKNAQKRPIGHSGAGTSESSVTLKQALRRSCISHASEAAAMKRLSKPTGSSDFSEAGNIKRLYATVIGQADRPLAEEKRSLLEIKTKSGRTALEASEQEAAASSRLHDLEACGRTADPLPQVSSAGPPRKVTRPSFQHVISLASKEAGIKPSAHLGKMSRGEPGPGPSIAISKPRGAELKKPHASPRPVRPTYVGKNTSKKKSTPEVVGSSEREAYSRSKMMYYGECTAASSAGAHNAAVSSRKGDYDEAMPGSTRRGDSCMGFEGKVRIGQRSREKGERSQSSKSSVGDYSTSTSISDESNQSISSGNGCKPHMSRDLRWTAIRHVEMNQGCIRLNNFKLLKRLGCGDIGTVYVAELVGSGCLFALKVMDNDFLLSRKKMPRAQTEREILQILDHPFLPTLYTYFTTDNLSCLVMEYCPGGDLHVLRQKQPWRSFSEPAARFYVAEVLLALEYLHMLGVIYRDLKPENILVREDGHIMLSDFDLSLRCSVTPVLLRSPLSGNAEAEETPSNFSCVDPLCLDPPCAKVSCLTPRLVPLSAARSKDQAAALPQLVAEPTEARSNSFVGTHEYLAPEIIKGEGHGSSVDWWTLGIFLYELLFGRTPFKGANDEETLMNIVTQDLCYPESPAVTVPAKELIRGLLVKDPERRLGSIRGATEIKRHPFFEGLNWALIRCTIPPETPAPDELLLPPPPPPAPAPAVVSRKKPARCLDFGNGEKVEFELF